MKKLISAFIIAAVLSTLLVSPATVSAAGYNYGEALQKAIMFYEFQMAGELPDNIRTNWRGDACVKDGSDVGLDLTGGWFDAGDHVKFNLPMAYTAAMLSWQVIEYKDAFEKSGQLPYVLDQIKWTTDYLIKCHPEKNVYYYQVGNGDADHRWWVPAECIDMQAPRPSYKVTTAAPGSTVCAETAAALAAAAVVFKDTNPDYAELCIKHAEELYDFAETSKSDAGYKEAENFYKSWSGWYDELSWAGAFLYMATGNQTYLNKAETYVAEWGLEERTTYIAYKWAHCWDDVHLGAALLLAKLTDKDLYKQTIERHLDYWSVGFEGAKITYSPKGLAHLTAWGPLRYATTTAFLAALYSDYEGCSSAKKETYMNFAKQQVDYCLGSSGMSYLIGYGAKYPEHPHHRTAQSSWCDSMSVPNYHRHTLVGALVGGPGSDDSYSDLVSDYVMNEVACDYNAGFIGVLAKLYNKYGGNPIANLTAIEEPTNEEIYVQAKVTGADKTQVTAKVFNKSGWPARNINTLSFRYFLDLSEYVSAGNDPQQITVGSHYSAATSIKISKPVVYDAAKKIYYVEVDLTGTNIYPGSNSDHQKEVQLYIQPPAGAPWDNTNDWSYIGAMEDSDVVPNIPVYEAGKFIFGVEPDGSTPNPSATTKPATPTPVVTPTNKISPTPTTSIIIGDADLSGSFNSIDMGILRQYLLGMPTILKTNPTAAMAADVDGNGLLNSIDLAYMRQRLLGMIKSFPI